MSLLLNFFYEFWPELIKLGFVKRLMTPIIKVYDKKKSEPIKTFFYEKDFDIWWEDNKSKTLKVKYFKGLATHSKYEVESIFKKLQNDIYTFTLTDEEKLFNIYFHADTTKERKQELKTKTDDNIVIDWKKKKISCQYQLQVDNKKL